MRLARRAAPVRLAQGEWRWLGGAILAGGVAGPVLLMYGLKGMAAIVGGALVLAWPGEVRFGAAWSALAVLGACAAWALDKNLTRKLSQGSQPCLQFRIPGTEGDERIRQGGGATPLL